MDFFTQDLLDRKDRAVKLLNQGRYLRMAKPQRPVDPEWKCQASGDCCTVPKEVVMTREEATTLVFHAPPTIKLEFRPTEEGFVAMKTGPCPLFVFKSCMVYEHRPYNCRRFLCMRPDPKSEPLEEEGWKNHMDRVQQDRGMRRLAIRNQNDAQRWARKHGWKVDDDARGGQREGADVSDEHGLRGDGQHGPDHKPDTPAEGTDGGHDGSREVHHLVLGDQ